MNALTLTELSPAGRIIIHEDEVELLSEYEGVHVFYQRGSAVVSELFENQVSMVTLTNMRLVIFV